MIKFHSDNTAGVAPQVMDALARANVGEAAAYGADEITRRLRALFCELFERDVWVVPVTSGIAANGLALAAIAPAFTSILCHHRAHIVTSENGAVEFFTQGARVVALPGEHGRIDFAGLRDGIASGARPQHLPWSALTLTQLTEAGTLYELDDVARFADLAHQRGARVHMDGARFANAIAALGCSPAQASWRLGVDVLSFGATKNGAMNADAVLAFDPATAESLSARARRAGQNLSKMRFMSAQLESYLSDGLWLTNARHANAMAARLAAGLREIPGVELLHPVQGNELFARIADPVVARLRARELETWVSRRDESGSPIHRLVASFETTAAEVDAFLDAARAPAAGGAVAS